MAAGGGGVGALKALAWPGSGGSRREFKWRWTGTTHKRRVQERLCISILLFYWIQQFLPYCLLERGKSCRIVLYTDPVIWEFHFLRGYCLRGRGSTVYVIVGYSVNPQKDTLDNLRTPAWYVSWLSYAKFQLSWPIGPLVLSLCGHCSTPAWPSVPVL
jgi:hypothetical protein